MTHEELLAKLEELEALIKTGSDYALAETQARELLRALPDEGGDNELHCRILLALSESIWQRGMANEALPFAEHGLALADKLEDKALRARAYGNIGAVCHYTSDYLNALEYWSCALVIHEKLSNKAGIAGNLSNIGGIYTLLSDYSRALEYLQRSLALNEELGHKAGIAINLSTLGNVYHNLSDYPRSLEYLKKSLAISEELGHKIGIATNLSNIGTGYINLSNCTLALEYFKKSLALNYEIERKEGIAISLGNIGNVYEILSDYTSALEYYHKALALNEEIKRIYGVAQNLSNIGMLYANVNFNKYDTIKAEEYLLKSIVLFNEIRVIQLEYEVHEHLADLYEQQERWKESQIHHKKYHELYLEVQSEEATKQAQLMEHRRKVEESERDRQVKLARFQEREKILDNILPSQITERLIKGEQPIADRAENVSVFFSDIVGFTTLSQKMSAKELVSGLNELFVQFDILAKKHGLEKIKTIGDAYMAVCGVPVAVVDHAERTANFALGIQELFANGITIAGHSVNVRIGLHCGEVVAGVIGEQKFAYDLWGDAVNTASRMESHGEAGKIHVSEEFVAELKANSEKLKVGKQGELLFTFNSSLFTASPRGEMEIKGKGRMKTYFLEQQR